MAYQLCKELVDSCYSYWQGAAVAMVDILQLCLTQNHYDNAKMEVLDIDTWDMECYLRIEVEESVNNSGDAEYTISDVTRIRPATAHNG